jgi:UDP-3-O-acyl-N-acetylglucosamine deacetylase
MDDITAGYGGGLMPAPLLITRNHEFVHDRLLPALRDLRLTTTTVLGDVVGYTPRHVLNYLKALQAAGQVEYIRAHRVWRAV